MLLEWWKLLRYRFFLYREPSGTAGALEEVSLRRNALFRNYGTRMFLLFCRLFSFFLFFSWSRFLTSEYLPTWGLFFLPSFVRPSPNSQPAMFRPSVPALPRVVVLVATTTILIPCRRCIRPSYLIILYFILFFFLYFRMPCFFFPFHLFRVDETIPPSSKVFSFNSTCCLLTLHALI